MRGMAQGFKTGGRQAGTPNKITAGLREILSELLKKQLENIGEDDGWIDTLSKDQRINLIGKLLPYVLPKVDASSPEQTEE